MNIVFLIAIGILAARIGDWTHDLYFRKYHIQRIAYELLPEGTFWCSLSESDKLRFLEKARSIYFINR